MTQANRGASVSAAAEESRAIAQQFAAARKALDKAYQEMLACLLEETVLDPARDDAETLARVRAIFTKYT